MACEDYTYARHLSGTWRVRAIHTHAKVLKSTITFYAALAGYDVIHLCVMRESTLKTGARGKPEIQFEPQ